MSAKVMPPCDHCELRGGVRKHYSFKGRKIYVHPSCWSILRQQLPERTVTAPTDEIPSYTWTKSTVGENAVVSYKHYQAYECVDKRHTKYRYYYVMIKPVMREFKSLKDMEEHILYERV